jgi:hypothetical protein
MIGKHKLKKTAFAVSILLFSTAQFAKCDLSQSDPTISIINTTKQKISEVRIKVSFKNTDGKVQEGSARIKNIQPGETEKVDVIKTAETWVTPGRTARKEKSRPRKFEKKPLTWDEKVEEWKRELITKLLGQEITNVYVRKIKIKEKARRSWGTKKSAKGDVVTYTADGCSDSVYYLVKAPKGSEYEINIVPESERAGLFNWLKRRLKK